MINRESLQIVCDVQSIKRDLDSKLPQWIDQAIEKLGFKQMSMKELEPIGIVLGINKIESKTIFFTQFAASFLRMLTPQNAKQVRTVEQLLLFAQNFIDVSELKSTSVLRRILDSVNASIQGFFRERKQHVFELSNREKNLKLMPQYSPPVPTQPITATSNEKCQHCLCSKGSISVQSGIQRQIIKCRICENIFHIECMKLPPAAHSQFMCPECVLLRLDPMHKIVDVLCEPVAFRPTQHAPSKTFTFAGERIGSNHVEVRCIRIDGKHGAEEPTWPDVGDVWINDKRVLEFRPLLNNSSLKRRKDEKLTTREFRSSGENVIKIREGVPTSEQKSSSRVLLGQVYFLGVFLVQPIIPQAFVDEVVQCEYNWMCIQDCKEATRLYMQKGSGNDIQVESLAVTLNCQFDTKLINTPVRGSLCEHLQCFSLENMALMMHKVAPRKWRCPICKSKCFELLIDSLQMLLISVIRKHGIKVLEVQFDAQGEVLSPDLAKLLSLENPAEHLPSYGIHNTNKNLQLEHLRGKSKKPSRVDELPTENGTDEIIEIGNKYEPKAKKKIRHNPEVRAQKQTQSQKQVQSSTQKQVQVQKPAQAYMQQPQSGSKHSKAKPNNGSAICID